MMYPKRSKEITPEEAANILQTSPEALASFENAYRAASIEEEQETGFFDNLFHWNAKQAAKASQKKEESPSANTISVKGTPEDLKKKIVEELLSETEGLPDFSGSPVTKDEVASLPKEIRPQITGTLIPKDIRDDSYLILLPHLQYAISGTNLEKRELAYQMFRQGLDILDLDPVVYLMLGKNKNSIGYWYPALKYASDQQRFFKIPKTVIKKVPLPILQLTRMDYGTINQTTKDIVNAWAYQAFGLEDSGTYFVKTGTYSSKFDFRNCKVTGAKEVRELGEYLLFIQYQAQMMASPLNMVIASDGTPHAKSIYGVSTTNEWCVREYIEDINTPEPLTIYHGLPLRNEMRVFIDCDEKKVLGTFMYWDPETMKKRFSEEADRDTPDKKHDYVTFLAAEEDLKRRFLETQEIVSRHVEKMLPDMDLHGQWSLDVMETNTNGKIGGGQFYLIDMALAQNSAFSEKLPKGSLKYMDEDWIPEIPEGKEKA